MVVRVLYSGSEVTGLRVGANNVRRYFPNHITSIELELDHLRIACKLAPDFWDGQPEIHDPRLDLWLKSKFLTPKPCRAPALLALIPSGENCFRLEPAKRNRLSRRREACSFVPDLEFERE